MPVNTPIVYFLIQDFLIEYSLSVCLAGGNDENLFSIDSTKGELRVRSELIGQGQYILTIKATNQEAPQYFATAEVRGRDIFFHRHMLE